MYKKKEPRYYMIRAEVVWGIAVCSLMLLITVFGGRKWIDNKEKIETIQEDRRETIDFTFEGMKSELRDAAYFIRDYWIEIDFDENEVEVSVFYLPERP